MDLEEALDRIRNLRKKLSDVENELSVALGNFDATITRPEDVGDFITQADDFYSAIDDIYRSI